MPNPFSVRLDPDLKASLESEAKREHVTPSQLATQAIRSLVEGRAAKRAMIDAALAEAEQGRFISQEAMTAWVDSWGTDDELPMPDADIAQ
ncbi:MAG: ribbon-helix-helix protein, CopG family [Rhodobacteraceae bacterium]|nr:ribbon-helix-helix protein, CopG family [Paracoccaceae bacterium]